MAASNRRDVELVVRAKAQVDRAFRDVSGSLQTLFSQAKDGSSDVAEIGRALLAVDKAAGSLFPAVERGTEAFDRQQRTLAETQAQLDAVKQQFGSATNALNKFRSASEADGADKQAYAAKIKATEAALASLGSEQRRLTASIRSQEAALGGSRSLLQQLASQANAVEAAIQGVGDETQRDMARSAAATAAQTKALRDQAAAARELAKADVSRAKFDRFLGVSSDPKGSIASQSAAVFEEHRRASEAAAAADSELTAQANRLRAAIDPLGVVQAKLNRELTEARSLYKLNKISAEELALTEKVLAANAKQAQQAIQRGGTGAGKAGVFGLRPHELTNVSYQLNDVFTQLASGTSVLQTLAQQGGQIVQIFPRVGSAIFGALTNPYILASAAGLTALTLAISHVTEQEDRVRAFSGALEAMADGARYNAAALAETTKALDNYGLSADNALKIVRTFLKEGVNPELIGQFGHTAKDMADVLGIDVTQAAQQMAQAFTGGYDAIVKLDDSVGHYLTGAQRQHIKQLYEEGKASDARTYALKIFTGEMDKAADKARGPWDKALRGLDVVWNNVLDSLSKTGPVQKAVMLLGLVKAGLEEIGEASAEQAKAVITAKDAPSAAGVDLQIAVVKQNIARIQGMIARESAAYTADIKKQMQADLNGLQKQLQQLEAERKRIAGNTDTDPKAHGTAAEAEANAAVSAATDKILVTNKAISDQKRIQLAMDEARREAVTDLNRDEMKGASDAIQTEYIRQKMAEARRKVEKQIREEKEAQKRADEQAIKSFAGKVTGVESSNVVDAVPRDLKTGKLLSSAMGLGQFIEDTWLKLFRKHFPDQAGKSDEVILALRKNADISKKMIEIYARENAEALKKAGQSVTEANLYLMHFLGPRSGLKVLKAGANTPISDLVGAGQITANKKVLQGKTAGQVRNWASGKFGEAFSADADITAKLVAMQDDLVDKQTEFNAKIDDENEKRTLGIKSLEAQRGLIGEALLAEQRKQEIANAVLEKQQEIDKVNADRRAKGLEELKFTEEQRKEIERTTGAYFDLQHAKEAATAKRTAVEQPVNDLTELRQSIMEQIDFYERMGNNQAVGELEGRLVTVNQKLDESISKALAFWNGIKGDPVAIANLGLTAQEVENITLKLQVAGSAAQDLSRQFLMTGRQFNESLADQGVQGFSGFIQSVVEGQNALAALRNSIIQTAAEFLLQIGQMILKQQLFNMLSAGGASGAGGFGGGVSGVIGSLFSAGLFHGGGVAGSAKLSRSVPASMFANAARYHVGGFAGLRPGEVPAILERGEEILTRSDARHRLNGGGKTAQDDGVRSIRQVLVMDPEEMTGAMAGTAGERVIVTAIKRNRVGIKQILDS